MSNVPTTVWILAGGGLLFLASDSLLAFNKFDAPIPLAPLWVLVPCHRVVGSDGTVRGDAWCADRRQRLLDREQAE